MNYMAKQNSYDTTTETSDDSVTKYVTQWSEWKEQLRPYWPEIKKSQEMYEFYKSEENETSSDVSLNTPFSIIESMVAKANDSTINVTAKAHGKNDMSDWEEYVAAITKDAIDDPDVARYIGTFRKTREMHFREMLVKGNAVSEAMYVYKTGMVADKKKVLADNPGVRVLSLFSVTFNPSCYMDQSDIYYVEKDVTFKSLKNEEFKEEDVIGEDGTKSKRSRGKYKNLDAVKRQMSEEGKLVDDDDMHNYAGDRTIQRKKEPIKLIERWEGPKLCVIAVSGSRDGGILIREEYDPLKIGTHPLLISMNYKVEGRPYAYGEISAIYKAVRAQDTILNQSIEMVNKYLRPSILVSDYEADLDAIIDVMEMGGVAYGNSQGITNIPTNVPPQAAFQSVDTLQQAIERTARFSPYATGQASQQTDKTQGTASGIQAIQHAAEPNFTIKLDCLNDTFMNPYGQICLPMVANLMHENEIRYSLIQGAKTEWIQATKNILLGMATIQDLVTIGMLNEEEIPEFLAEMELEPNEKSMTETIVFDVDWLITCKLDNQSAADKERDLQKQMAWIQFGQQLGVQFEPNRTLTRIGKEQGIEDPEEFYMSDQELQAQQQQAMQAQQMQADQQLQIEQQKSQTQLQQKQMELQAQSEQQRLQAQQEIAKETLKGMNQMNVASTRQPVGAR